MVCVCVSVGVCVWGGGGGERGEVNNPVKLCAAYAVCVLFNILDLAGGM